MLRPLLIMQTKKQVPYHTNNSTPRNIKPCYDSTGAKLPWTCKSTNAASRRNSHSSFVELQPTAGWAPTTTVHAANQGNLDHNLEPVGPKNIIMTTRLDWEENERRESR